MSVPIKQIPKEDRPYERLINLGVESLSNEELLAILIKSGTKKESSKDIARKLLSNIGGIKRLNEINFENLKKYDGIGSVKACTLISAIELGKRINNEVDSIKNIKLTSSDLVYKYYKDRLGTKKQEYFYAIYLDNSKKIIEDKLLFIGTINYSLVHPREVFKEAYLSGASAIICVHNHPSGNVLPSKQDIDITNNLISVGKILGIKIVDHVIISNANYYSFLENGDIVF